MYRDLTGYRASKLKSKTPVAPLILLFKPVLNESYKLPWKKSEIASPTNESKHEGSDQQSKRGVHPYHVERHVLGDRMGRVFYTAERNVR
jgi:hypothetical protein